MNVESHVWNLSLIFLDDGVFGKEGLRIPPSPLVLDVRKIL